MATAKVEMAALKPAWQKLAMTALFQELPATVFVAMVFWRRANNVTMGEEPPETAAMRVA